MPVLPNTIRYVRRETFRSNAFRPYVIALGQLALAWNDLHENLGFLFTTILGSEGHLLPIWYSSKQDRSARAMLEAVIGNMPFHIAQKFPQAADEIGWLLGQANKLEDARNDALHSPLYDWKTPELRKVEPFAYFGHSRAIKLAQKPDLLAEYHWCRDTALALRD